MTEAKSLLRCLPKVDELLQQYEITQLLEMIGREKLVDIIRETIDDLRNNILLKEIVSESDTSEEAIIETVKKKVKKINEIQIRKVINGSGVVLHTNLGRAPLGPYAQEIIQEISQGYSNLEINLETGKRGSRYQHIKDLILALTGAEDAIVVNNNAGSVLLALSAVAKGKEVIISRGELVEIGGSFRVPEVMEQSGAKLVEVGATNKSYLKDYQNAITENTAALLKVHRSNFKLVGFTHETDSEDLVELGNKKQIPVINDLGSGLLIDLQKYGYPYEPTVKDVVNSGCDIITFSGDKLLGGTQAGIIVGKKHWIKIIESHPLTRALRVDKLTLSALEATLKQYIKPENAIQQIPVLQMMTGTEEDMLKKAERFIQQLPESIDRLKVSIKQTTSQVGGGSYPGHEMNSYAIVFEGNQDDIVSLERFLRTGTPSVIGRLSEGVYLLDVRTLVDKEMIIISERLKDWVKRSEKR